MQQIKQILKQIFRNNGVIRYMYEEMLNSRFRKRIRLCWKGLFHKRKLYDAAAKTIDKFHYTSKLGRKELIRDMVNMYILYAYSFKEYLMLHFDTKVMEERLQFISNWERIHFASAMNCARNADVFDNKANTYKVFKNFYHRKIYECNSETTYNEFSSFLNELRDEGKLSFAVKPMRSSLGHGFSICSVNCSKSQFEKMQHENPGGFLVEELIIQEEEIARLHPQSVNTVRMPTIRFDNETLIVHPCFRVGRHDSLVDNGGAGGIICAVDPKSGIVLAAADEFGNHYEVHPETGARLIGYKVPKWDGAIKLAKQLAEILPDNRYTGWDMALTAKGWVLVEANRRGHFIWQIPLDKGCRTEFEEYLKRLGKLKNV